MKGLHATALCICIALATASILPELEGNPPTPIPEFCRLEILSELRKCSCFVETREGTITDEVKRLCVSAFGDDLISLEDSCKNYLEDGEININAMRKDIARAIKICVPLYLEIAQGGIDGNGLGGALRVIGAQA